MGGLQILTCGIMAASVQNDDVVCLGGFQCAAHVFEQQFSVRHIVVRIALDAEAACGENRLMGRPGWGRQPYPRGWRAGPQKIGGDPKSARSAGGLETTDSAAIGGLMVWSEQQFRHHGVEIGAACR